MSDPEPIRLEIDVQGSAPSGAEHIVADLFLPPPSATPAGILLCCLPGGGMSRRYWDLQVADELGEYSMARYLARQGFAVATIDPLGVGDSGRPDDGYALTPSALADVNDVAIRRIIAGLREGTLRDDVAAVPTLRTVGVGHSAGGLLTVHQQARHRTYDALALLGFAGGGLPSHLTEDERAFAGKPQLLRDALAALVEARFGDPLPMRSSTAVSPMLVKGASLEAALSAMAASGSSMLALVGLTSMIPGSSDAELAAIDVPVFLGVGELDITGTAHEIPSQFPNTRDVSLFVLAHSGHNHNVSDNRTDLWDRLGAWARSVLA